MKQSQFEFAGSNPARVTAHVDAKVIAPEGLNPSAVALALMYFTDRGALTLPEWAESQVHAQLCHQRAVDLGYKPAHGCSMAKALDRHRKGSPGEMFAYKWAGVPWKSTEGTYNRADMLGRFQIRTSPRDDLRVHPEDEDWWMMISVQPTGGLREYRIAGCMEARWCKKEIWWENPGQGFAFFVPHIVLQRWWELAPMIEQAKLLQSQHEKR